jgi:Zn finger protein HypA/HybF involved in hydrogenase expression
MTNDVEYKKDIEKLKKIVSESNSLASVLRQYNMCTNGANPKRLRQFLIEQQIDFSHFNNPKDFLKSFQSKYSLEQILSNEVLYEDTRKLKRRLIKAGLKENKCEKCGIAQWQGMPLVIQLHHIDGNHHNNSLENLQMLCPNCHSQTHNFTGKNNKKSLKKKTKHSIKDDKAFIEKMLTLWNEGKIVKEIAKICNISQEYASKILRANGITTQEIRHRANSKIGKKLSKASQRPICLVNKNNEVVKVFKGLNEVVEYIKSEKLTTTLDENIKRQIRYVCNGRNKTSYGLYWKWANK